MILSYKIYLSSFWAGPIRSANTHKETKNIELGNSFAFYYVAFLSYFVCNIIPTEMEKRKEEIVNRTQRAIKKRCREHLGQTIGCQMSRITGR